MSYRPRSPWPHRARRYAHALIIGAALVLVLAAAGTHPVQTEKIAGQIDRIRPVGLNKTAQPSSDRADLLPPGAEREAFDAARDVPNWVDGELAPPLPRDPDIRRAAIAEARARARAATGRAPDVTYTASRRISAIPHVIDADLRPEPTRAGYEPTQSDLETISLKIPDDFKLPPDVLRAASEQGTIDEATESALSQTLIQSFQGLGQTNLSPPDCDLAVGPNHIVLVVNAVYAVYDRCGNLIVQSNLGDLVGDLTSFVFDPKVIYDDWSHRWVMCFAKRRKATQEAWIAVLATAGSDPWLVGSGWIYNFDWGALGVWADYPDLGVGPDGVYLTTNDFDWNFSTPGCPTCRPAFQRARIGVIDKTTFYVGLPTTMHSLSGMTDPATGFLAFALRATEMKTWPGQYYLVNSCPGGGAFLTLWKLGGTLAAPVVNGYNIVVGAYDNPPPLQQPNGTYVDCGDARLLTSRYRVSRLWTTHAQAVDWGTGLQSAIEVYIVDTATPTIFQETGPYGGVSSSYAYPALDFDVWDRGIVCFSRGGPTEFLGTGYADVIPGGSWGTSTTLVWGQANFVDLNSGSQANPYRWGDYYGCDLDKSTGGRTLWFHGEYATNNPAGQWSTYVGATSYDGPGVMNVTPSGPFVSTGLEGGPFTPASITYQVDNTGGSTLAWRLSGLAAWETATATGGPLPGGGSTLAIVAIDTLVANGMAAGTYANTDTFTNCYTGATFTRQTQLTIGTDGRCPGAIVRLTPAGTPGSAGDDNQERGVYVTALKDYRICAVAMKQDLVLPQTLIARIYAANGTTRGALLSAGSLTAVQPGDTLRYIPIDYTLQACRDYDITVQFGTANAWPWWDENALTEPYDVGGAIRVRDGEQDGNAGNFALADFSLIGAAVNPPLTADLDPQQATTPASAADANQERGVFIVADETTNLCSFGWEADLVAPQTLTARLYAATDTTRGALIATGTLDVTSSGMQFHDVPIDAVLEEGNAYDLSIEFGWTNSWPWWDETALTEPYAVGPIRVVDAEIAGDAANFALPHYRVNYRAQVAGAPYDVVEPFFGPAPLSTTFGGAPYGMYVSALHDEELYTVGWEADVPEGEVIVARVYAATGVTRGALVTEGTITSSGGGMAWHDVPVAASLVSGADYDIEIEMPVAVNAWDYWDDRAAPAVPYNAYGILNIVDSEQGGDAGNYALIHARINACDAVTTAVGDTPVRTPRFALKAPYPNPVSLRATLEYSLDTAGPVTMTVYDVAGRRVATILDDPYRSAGPGRATFDASQVAAGVYFVKMKTATKTVSRKITVVR